MELIIKQKYYEVFHRILHNSIVLLFFDIDLLLLSNRFDSVAFILVRVGERAFSGESIDSSAKFPLIISSISWAHLYSFLDIRYSMLLFWALCFFIQLTMSLSCIRSFRSFFTHFLNSKWFVIILFCNFVLKFNRLVPINTLFLIRI